MRLSRPERPGPDSERGRPLEPASRAAMESAFGVDFGPVRIRTDPAAGREAVRLGARAVTSNEEILFAPGRFAPGTPAGRHLLAHELAHVVQQRGGTREGVGPAGGSHEQAVDQAARAVTAGGRAHVTAAGSAPAVQLDRETGGPVPAGAPVADHPPKLFPPPVREPEPETDEERIGRVVSSAGPDHRPTTPATNLRDALGQLLKRCERDQRLAGVPTSLTRPATSPPQNAVERSAELKRRVTTCLETPEGKQFTALATEVALSQEGLPYTIMIEPAGLGLTGSPTYVPAIPLGDRFELALDFNVRTPSASAVLTFKGDPSWVDSAATGVVKGVLATGAAIGGGAVAVGRGVAAGVRFIAGGVAAGARAVGRGIAAGARGVAAGAHAVGRGVATAARAVGSGFAAAARFLGRGIAAGARGVAHAARAGWNGISWVGGQLWDKVTGTAQRLGSWISALPVRVGRLLTGLWEGVRTLRPWSLDWWRSLGSVSSWTGLLKWLGGRLVDLIDVLGVGEAYETVMDFAKFNTTTLSTTQRGVAQRIFGSSINLDLVRLDEHAVIGPAFSERQYTSFHTINGWGATPDDVLIHELTHVWQYEQAGAVYMPQALHAQLYGAGYAYGGAAGLRTAKAARKGLAGFNREQQAQIVQDFSKLHQGDPDGALYADFVAEVSSLTPAQLVAGLKP